MHSDFDNSFQILNYTYVSEMLGRVAGGPSFDAGHGVSGVIPFDDPVPSVVFAAARFALTGQFVFGPCARVGKAIEGCGGSMAPSLSGKCGYLIVGTFGSEEWLHSNFGTKIAKAVKLKAAGKALQIVSEQHWTEQMLALQGAA